VEADFRAQVFSTDHVAVETAIVEVGKKSFTLLQRLIDIKTHEIKCVGKTIMVAFDLEKNSSIPMREEWVEAICKYEGRDVRRKK
jgi:acyl-CoA thioester hydrolase